MKKLIACTLIGAMLCGMTVSAAGSPSAAVVASSVSATVEAAAAAESKSVGEYTNNAIVETPGQDRVDTLSLTEPPVM